MKIVRRCIGTFIAFASIGFFSMAAASDLDQDCNPRGWVQKLGAWWDPAGFWSAQPTAIQKEVESRVKGYQVYLVQRQADAALAANEREKARIEQAALEEQLRILGVQTRPIPPETQRNLNQTLATADKTIRETYVRLDEAQRQGVASAIQWGEKCVAFSKEQLTKARR